MEWDARKGRGTRFSGGSAGRAAPRPREIPLRPRGEADGVPVGARSVDRPPYPPDGLRVESQTACSQSGHLWRVPQEGIANLAEHQPESVRRIMPRSRLSDAARTGANHVNSGKTGRDWQLFRLFHAFPMYWVLRLCVAETIWHVFVKPLSIRKDATCRPQRHPRSLGSCRSPRSGAGRKRSETGPP